MVTWFISSIAKDWPELTAILHRYIGWLSLLADWHQTGGVLLLGYEMYRLLIKTKGVVAKPKRSAKKASAEPLVIDVEEEEFNKELVKG